MRVIIMLAHVDNLCVMLVVLCLCTVWDATLWQSGVDIVAPSASKAPVWKYFGYVKDLATGKAAIGKKATCKLC